MTQEIQSSIGLKDVVYAKLVSDDKTGVAYDQVKPAAPAISAAINRGGSASTTYADDRAIAVGTTPGVTTIELGVTHLPKEVQADWFGHEIVNGVLVRRGTDKSPYIALGFRSETSDGSFKYVWLFKGKFTPPSMEHGTKGESIEAKTPTTTGTFISRNYDEASDIDVHDTDTNLPQGLIENWLKAVVDPAKLTATP